MIGVDVLLKFFIALALGTLIGLEREYARYRERGHTYAGIRTFPLMALFGAIAAYLGQTISLWILYISLLLLGLLIVVAYFILAEQDQRNSGATSEIAGFLTFFIGILSFHGEYSFALILSVIIATILYARSLLHGFAQKITPKEMVNTLLFAIIAFVVLPLLPNQWYGPLQLFNPYLGWLMVVFISGISFLGYALMKWFGEKGVGIAGILGGLVSSTAVTMSFAEKSKKHHKLFKALAIGVILANGVMFIRILVEVFAINHALFIQLFPSLGLLLVVTAVFSYFFWKKIRRTKVRVEVESPFRLAPAIKFALFFALILAATKLAHLYLSTKGVYVISFLSGLADVDAVTLSLSQLSLGTLTLATAKKGILIAALTNIAVKGGIAYKLGGKEFGRLILGFFAVLVVIGIILLIL